MGDSEHRHISRDSLFVLAGLRIEGTPGEQRVRVRNLSSGGLMAEGGPALTRGQIVWIEVRNAGWVEGSVAWVQGSRCGIAFRDEIDTKGAKPARSPTAPAEDLDLVVRRPAFAPAAPPPSESGPVRKI